MYLLGPSGTLVVVLLPGVNLYPSSSSLSYPSLAFCCSVRACLLSGLCVGCLLPQGCGRSCACLVACPVRVCFCPRICRSFFVFFRVFSRVFGWPGVCLCLVVPLASSRAVWSVDSVFPFALISFSRPRAALPVGIPWALGEPCIDSFNSRECNF